MPSNIQTQEIVATSTISRTDFEDTNKEDSLLRTNISRKLDNAFNIGSKELETITNRLLELREIESLGSFKNQHFNTDKFINSITSIIGNKNPDLLSDIVSLFAKKDLFIGEAEGEPEETNRFNKRSLSKLMSIISDSAFKKYLQQKSENEKGVFLKEFITKYFNSDTLSQDILQDSIKKGYLSNVKNPKDSDLTNEAKTAIENFVNPEKPTPQVETTSNPALPLIHNKLKIDAELHRLQTTLTTKDSFNAVIANVVQLISNDKQSEILKRLVETIESSKYKELSEPSKGLFFIGIGLLYKLKSSINDNLSENLSGDFQLKFQQMLSYVRDFKDDSSFSLRMTEVMKDILKEEFPQIFPEKNPLSIT